MQHRRVVAVAQRTGQFKLAAGLLEYVVIAGSEMPRSIRSFCECAHYELVLLSLHVARLVQMKGGVEGRQGPNPKCGIELDRPGEVRL